jgi:hypothetical protein
MKQPLRREEIGMEQPIEEENKETEKLLCPKAGTTTSSPIVTAQSQTLKASEIQQLLLLDDISIFDMFLFLEGGFYINRVS